MIRTDFVCYRGFRGAQGLTVRFPTDTNDIAVTLLVLAEIHELQVVRETLNFVNASESGLPPRQVLRDR